MARFAVDQCNLAIGEAHHKTVATGILREPHFRLGIGFGVGKSIVEAKAELYAIVPDGPPVLLQTCDGKSDSGRQPGMAVGASMAVAHSSAAAGALSALMNVGGEVRRSPVGKEAASLGHRLATDIGEFAAERGWISVSSVPALKR